MTQINIKYCFYLILKLVDYKTKWSRCLVKYIIRINLGKLIRVIIIINWK